MNAGPEDGLRPSGIPERELRMHRLRRRTPLLVWVAVLIVTGLLYQRQEAGHGVTAFAAEVRRDVAAESAGRLEHLAVKLNQKVAAGQIVATFDRGHLLLQLQEARAELQRLVNELGRQKALWEIEAAGHRTDQLTNLRRFAGDAAGAHVEYLTALAALGEDRIKLQGLEITLGRTRQLAAEELTAAAMLDADRVACEALAEKVAKQETAVETMFESHRQADARYRELLGNSTVAVPGNELVLLPLESAIRTQEIRIEAVNLALADCALRAPGDGLVVEILRRPGEVVAAGQPVLSIVDARSTELVAYLPENRIHDVQPGDVVSIRGAADPRHSHLCRVASRGSAVQQLPLRAAPTSAVPTWGLAVSIELPGSLSVMPGESFAVTFKSRGR